MPIPLPRLFRGLVLLALALHVFCMYSLARGMRGELGFEAGTTMLAAAFALAMLIPLVWAVWIPEMPEIYTRHLRARRWFNQGKCPACGYPAAGAATERLRCTECGAPIEQPQPYQVKARTVRLFIAMNVLAWIAGSAAGEAWALQDERAFASEAAAHALAAPDAAGYSRPRWWPGGAMLLRTDEATAEKGGEAKAETLR